MAWRQFFAQPGLFVLSVEVPVTDGVTAVLAVMVSFLKHTCPMVFISYRRPREENVTWCF
jgi:hypothetical protein